MRNQALIEKRLCAVAPPGAQLMPELNMARSFFRRRDFQLLQRLCHDGPRLPQTAEFFGIPPVDAAAGMRGTDKKPADVWFERNFTIMATPWFAISWPDTIAK